MATMVNIWLSELTKLKEKIQLEKKYTKKSNMFLKSRSIQHVEKETSTKPGSMVPVKVEKQVSEETVFGLMDRYAPS